MIDRTEEEIMKNWKGDHEKPLVSICSITYNHEKFIEEALDSFLMQETDFPFEIVVDDDCSSDDTANIIRSYKEKYPRIINANLRNQNIGSMPNFIANMKRAKGVYIALCEGDDYWTDIHKLQYQVTKMREYSDIDISFHPCNIVVEKRYSDSIMAKHHPEDKIFNTSDLIKGSGNFCPTASLMLRRSVIENLPEWFHDAPVGDYFLQVLASYPQGALYINRTMCIYRQGNHFSWSSTMKNIYIQEKFFKEMINSYKSLDKELNYEYSDAIKVMTLHRYKTMAMLYLEHRFFSEFQDILYDISQMENISLGKEITFYMKMRKYPKALLWLRKNKRFLKFIRNFSKFFNF